MKRYTTKESTKIKKYFEKEIKRATTIDELVWIDTEYKPNTALTCDDLLALCRMSSDKQHDLKVAGQKYTRARKPAWR